MKIDLHCHSFYSEDSIASPESLIEAALKKGLDGIALTDHNNTDGWEKAKKAAQKLGAVLISGEEIKIKKNGKTTGEILAYFITQEINPERKTTEEIIAEIHKQNGIAIIAHPYHWRKPFKELEKYKDIADGIEVFNSRSQSRSGNQKSLYFAQKNALPMTAGSDCHSPHEVGSAYIETEAKTIEEFRKMLLEKKIKIVGKQNPVYVQIFATIGKLFHLFWNPEK